MYRYENPSWKQTAFADFIENDYQKVKAEIVPREASASYFDFENATKIIPVIIFLVLFFYHFNL